jgi:hypothetical protein
MKDQLEAEHHAREQLGLDEDQMLADLGQSIADREQAFADREQTRLDETTSRDASGHDVEDPDDAAQETRMRHLGSEHLKAQSRHDSRQAQINQAQHATEEHQDLLDAQQTVLDEFAGPGPTTRADERRASAAALRAQAATRRAEAAAKRERAFNERQLLSGSLDTRIP